MQSTLLHFVTSDGTPLVRRRRPPDECEGSARKHARMYDPAPPLSAPAPRNLDTRVACMYEVPASQLSRAELRKHTEALTMVPKDPYQRSEESSFPAYVLAHDTLSVPRWYGTRVFGPAHDDATQLGVEMSSEAARFAGGLQPHQHAPTKAVLDVCSDATRPSPRGGMVCIGCGQGKTVCALFIAAQLRRRTLVLCHTRVLVDQWKERAGLFLPRAKVGLIRQSTLELDADIVIASLQSVAMRDYDAGTFAGFGLLIIDEAHHLSAPCLSRALQKMPMRYVLGLTATPERRDGLTPLLFESMGPILYRAEPPQERVMVTRLVYTNATKQVEILGRNNKPAFALMLNRLADDTERTALVAQHLHKHLRGGRQIIVLSDRIHQLEAVLAAVIAIGTSAEDAALYTGRCSAAERERASTKQLVLSSYSMAREGLDLARLDTLCLLTPASSVEQATGRILRPNAGKKTPLVLDIVDGPFSIFAHMSQKRKRYYSSRSYEIQDAPLGGWDAADARLFS